MTALRTAREFLNTAPREAAADMVGICAIAVFVFSGFFLPGLF